MGYFNKGLKLSCLWYKMCSYKAVEKMVWIFPIPNDVSQLYTGKGYELVLCLNILKCFPRLIMFLSNRKLASE